MSNPFKMSAYQPEWILKRASHEKMFVFLCLCVSVSVRQSPPVNARLLFHLKHLLFLSELSGQTSTVCLLCLFRCNHFSHICRLVMAAKKPIPPCAYSITEGYWELSCLAAPSQRLCTDISKQSDLLVGTCDVWSLRRTWGRRGNSARPVQKFLEVC